MRVNSVDLKVGDVITGVWDGNSVTKWPTPYIILQCSGPRLFLLEYQTRQNEKRTLVWNPDIGAYFEVTPSSPRESISPIIAKIRYLNERYEKLRSKKGAMSRVS